MKPWNVLTILRYSATRDWSFWFGESRKGAVLDVVPRESCRWKVDDGGSFSGGSGSGCLGVSRWRPKVDLGGPCPYARLVSRGNQEH